MSADKRNKKYPERPPNGKRPSRPGAGTNKRSTTHGGGLRKGWQSDRSVWEGGRDISPRRNVEFHKQPIPKAARLKKQRELWPTKGN